MPMSTQTISTQTISPRGVGLSLWLAALGVFGQGDGQFRAVGRALNGWLVGLRFKEVENDFKTGSNLKPVPFNPAFPLFFHGLIHGFKGRQQETHHVGRV